MVVLVAVSASRVTGGDGSNPISCSSRMLKKFFVWVRIKGELQNLETPTAQTAATWTSKVPNIMPESPNMESIRSIGSNILGKLGGPGGSWRPEEAFRDWKSAQ